MKSGHSSVASSFAFKILCFLTIALFLSAFAQEKVPKKQKLDIQNLFIASGYMGDGEYGQKYISFDGACEVDPHSAPTCIKIKYTFGAQRWAGIYWQNKPDNWGDQPGTNYSKKGFTKVTLWAKGSSGKEVVEFKTGDIHNTSKKFHDSFSATTGRITLSKEWKQYELDLEGADLSSVIGGFCWVASKDFNSQESIEFFIDDIFFEQ
jgi:hypothetical protein